MSKLKFLNYFILQWFFIRLAKVVNIETGEIVEYKILKWVVPTTGWVKPYKFLFKEKK